MPVMPWAQGSAGEGSGHRVAPIRFRRSVNSLSSIEIEKALGSNNIEHYRHCDALAALMKYPFQ